MYTLHLVLIVGCSTNFFVEMKKILTNLWVFEVKVKFYSFDRTQWLFKKKERIKIRNFTITKNIDKNLFVAELIKFVAELDHLNLCFLLETISFYSSQHTLFFKCKIVFIHTKYIVRNFFIFLPKILKYEFKLKAISKYTYLSSSVEKSNLGTWHVTNVTFS